MTREQIEQAATDWLQKNGYGTLYIPMLINIFMAGAEFRQQEIDDLVEELKNLRECIHCNTEGEVANIMSEMIIKQREWEKEKLGLIAIANALNFKDDNLKIELCNPDEYIHVQYAIATNVSVINKQ